jgi:hypothetical protein
MHKTRRAPKGLPNATLEIKQALRNKKNQCENMDKKSFQE